MKSSMVFDDGLAPVFPVAVGRKRPSSSLSSSPSSKASRQRWKAKRARLSGEGLTPRVSCTHHSDNYSNCHADKLSEEDVAFNFATMHHASQTKVEQDKLILRLATVSSVRRIRVARDARKRPRDVSAKYSLLSHAPPHHRILVCKTTFIRVLGKIFSLLLFFKCCYGQMLSLDYTHYLCLARKSIYN